jgi:hypothetical protein
VVQHAAMPHRTIPIQSASAAPVPPPMPPKLAGDVARAEALLPALESAVSQQLGRHLSAGHWLRAFSLQDGEAVLSVSNGLGHQSLESADIAFQTLKRLLPDTDIYVGASRH